MEYKDSTFHFKKVLTWLLLSYCMDQIPVSFDYDGKHYTGYFKAVSGAAGKLWHLIVNGYHWGQLFYTENFGWRFENNHGTLKELTDYFADVVTNWYE